MDVYPILSWKNQNFYINQQMPRIPGELVAKRNNPKKKGLKSKEHKFAVYPPPNATNMEVNLRIVHFVNVEYFFFALR